MPMPRRSLPLTLTLVVHLLLIACLYLARHDVSPTTPSTPQRIWLALIARPDPLPEQPASPPPPMARPAVRTPARPARPVHTAPREAVAEAMPAPEVPPASAGDILARARREVGNIDRELRAAGSIPAAAGLSADSPRARFERALEGAWIDRSNSMVVDRYRSGDGVVIERVTRRGRSTCYMSGVINFVPGILHDSSRPQSVSCPPPGSGWTRK